MNRIDGTGDAYNSDIPLRDGERRTVTVLFSDMHGFTGMSFENDPEVIEELMNRVYGVFETAVRSRGGVVEKYIGDALVAVFGNPVLHEDDPVRALESAVDFNQQVSALGKPPLLFRTGVHTGLVATGKRGAYDVVTGYTMACASRIQTGALPGQILVSETTVNKCRHRFDFGESHSFVPKGDPHTFFVRPLTGRRRSPRVSGSPFVGRKAEQESVVGSYFRPIGGERQGIYIHGEAGIGKSRLAREVCGRIVGIPRFDARIFDIDASLYPERPYSTVMCLFLESLHLMHPATPGSLSHELAKIVPQLPARTEQVFSALLSGIVPADESVVHDLLTIALDAVLSDACSMFPCIVIIDNAGYLDEESRVFFRTYLSGAAEKPYFMICDRIFRSEVASLFGIEKEIHLGPLDEPESEELVHALVEANTNDHTIRRIVQLSLGYPLFIEEYARLVCSGAPITEIPDTIQTVVLASIDRYTPAQRGVLRSLSVFRSPFTEDAVIRLVAQDLVTAGEAESSMNRFVEDGILILAGTVMYSFRHAIIRDALYGSLLNHNKRILHARAAAILSDQRPPRHEEMLHHLVGANLWDKARRFLFSQVIYPGPETEPLLRRLLEQTGPEMPEARIEVLFKLYAVQFNNHVYKGLEPILFEMLELARSTRIDACLARTYHLFLTYYLKFGDLPAAIRFGERAIERYARCENARGDANARFFLVEAFCRLGEYERALGIIDGIPGDTQAGMIFGTKARLVHAQYVGDYRSLERWRRTVLEYETISGDHRSALEARYLEYSALLQNFEFTKALGAGLPESVSGVENDTAVFFDASVAAALWNNERHEDAEARYERALYFFDQLRGEDIRCTAGMWLAWSCYLMGRKGEALHRATEALDQALVSKCLWIEFEANVFIASVANLTGDQSLADFHRSEAASLNRCRFHRERRIEALYRRLSGDFAGARALIERELEQLVDDDARRQFLSIDLIGEIMTASV